MVSLPLANFDDLRRGVTNVAVVSIDKVGEGDGSENSEVDVLGPAASLFLDRSRYIIKCQRFINITVNFIKAKATY